MGRLGIHSALALPLLVPDETIGALTVYARAKDAFDARAIELGEFLARPAVISVVDDAARRARARQCGQ